MSTDKRTPSLKNLKAYAKDLNPQVIPLFVTEICELIGATDSHEDDIILVFETLARFHGQKVIPNIGKIMSTILRILYSSSNSFESCSKVVSAIALYGIDPLAPEKDNMNIIQSVCKPLSDALMCFDVKASSGAAFCINGLVNLDIWRFAPNEIVNEVCLKVTGAIGEASILTNSHIALVLALAKHNGWVLEAYVRSIIRSGLKILSESLEVEKYFSVIQMIDFLMRCFDARSFFSEIESVIEFMEKCQNCQLYYVQDAAFEATQTAKTVAALRELRESSDLRKECEAKASRIGADSGVKNYCSPPELPCHESQSLLYDSFVRSALSSGRSNGNIRGIRHADKRICNIDDDSESGENKDGFFGLYGKSSMVYFEHLRKCEVDEECQGCRTSIQSPNFNSTNLSAEPSCTNSKRSCSIDDVRMTSTSRRLIPSLHTYNNSTFRNLDRPNEVDYHNTLYRRVSSANENMSKEHLIRHKLLREGKNEQTLNLRKFNVSKVPFGKICGISVIFLVIILLAMRLITIDEVLFDVFPT